MPRLKWIKLYVAQWQYMLLPPWQFWNALQKRFSLWEKIIYNGEPTEEQRQVITHIDLRWDRTGLIEMKTGRWKSHVIMWITTLYQEPTLIVVHNLTTLQDMVQKFKEYTNYVPGVYSSKKKDIKEITITTHASFSKKVEEFEGKFWVVIIDECDYNFTTSMLNAICKCDCDALFWLSWTPQRKELDKNDMQLVFGDLIKIKTQDSNWYNIIPDIQRILYTTDRFFSFRDRHDLKNKLIADIWRIQTQIGSLIQYVNSEQTKWGLLLVERKEQECDMYYKELKDRWIHCCIVNGDTKAEDDEKNISDIYSRGWIIIWTVGKMWRGKDIPFLDTIFLFFPNKFESSTVQAVGRGLRSFPGKRGCLLVDWCDMPILKNQAYERLQTYKNEYTEDVKVTDIKILDYTKEEDKVSATSI